MDTVMNEIAGATRKDDKRILFIVNPVAGTMHSKTAMFTVINEFCKKGYKVTTAITQKRGHAEELAAEADPSEYGMIVCCGGDGTLNETLTGLMKAGKSIPLGYIPAGSTNDFATTLGISSDPEKAAKAITKEKPFLIDVGHFNGNRYFSYVASFGAFTATSYNVPQEYKNSIGHLAYILGGIKDLASIKSMKVSIDADGKQTNGSYIFGAVCNTRSVAGILRLPVDDDSLHDGQFEIFLVKKPVSLLELNSILSGVTLNDFSSSMFTFQKAARIEITMENEAPWSLDGEKAEGGKKVVIEAIPNAVTLYK